MSSEQAVLFEVDTREGDPTLVHVLMPCMAYACGGSILTKAGHFTVGASASTWAEVTCPACRRCGCTVLVREQRRQQGVQA